MAQSRAEAEALMEQQHYPADYISPQDAGLADPDDDEEQEDEAYWYMHEADDNELLDDCPYCGQITLTEDNKCYSCGWRAE